MRAGPAHYDLRGDISKNVKNGVIYSAPREKKKDVKGPGPTHYHVRVSQFMRIDIFYRIFIIKILLSSHIHTHAHTYMQ